MLNYLLWTITGKIMSSTYKIVTVILLALFFTNRVSTT